MDNALYTLASAMDIATYEQQRIANNLANTETTGFREVVGWAESDQDLYHQPSFHTTTSTQQGSLENTGSSLDVAIEGDGFIVVSAPDSEQKQYWRSGRLRVDQEGYVTNLQGLRLQGSEGPIKLEDPELAEQLQIDKTGAVKIGNETIDILKMVSFDKPEKLISADGGYINPDNMPEKPTTSQVRQGQLEKSNVDSTVAMTDMITNLRYLQAVQHVTNLLDEGWQGLMDV